MREMLTRKTANTDIIHVTVTSQIYFNCCLLQTSTNSRYVAFKTNDENPSQTVV